MKRYKPKIALMPDMVTGFSEGIMAVPQGMSYALLANMDPIYGLYCGLIYPMVYMFFGSSIHCSFGVSAIEAVLVADTINSTIGEHAPQDFRVEATLLLSVLMGLVFVAMRLAGLGVLADFLADPVLSGFSSASAIVIATKQFGYLFGIEEVTSSWMVVQMWQLVSNLGSTNWVALTMGCCGMGLLVAFRYINKRFKVFSRFPLPGALVLIVVTTLITWLARLDISHGLEIVGFIPEGLPKFTTPFSISYPHDTPAVTTASPSGAPGEEVPYEYNLGALPLQLLPRALPLCFIYFVIHISITKTLAKKEDLKLDCDQELLAMGFANIVGSMFSCFPNATSLSRSTVNQSIGCKSVLHNLPYSLMILLTLLVLTPALYYLPMTTLAAIVIVGVWNILDFKTPARLWKLGGLDFWIWLTAFSVTALLGAMAGVFASVALSIIWLLKKSARPSAAILGQLPGTTVYRSKKRFPMYSALI
eukprot:Selendium_serpulae@DN11363_c0_g1_i2.p1